MLKVTIITIGNKMPAWVDQAVKEFSKRLQEYISCAIIEIPLLRRGKSSDTVRIMEKEMIMMSAAIPNHARIIALDINGEVFSSEKLASKLERLQHITGHLCLLIGGPEGLSQQLIARSDERWSLSSLTLPHPIVRVVLLEALYRAWAIIHNHPYHK